MKEEYQCEHCGGVFNKIRSDEEVIEETKTYFPEDDLKDLAIICDGCFKIVMRQ